MDLLAELRTRFGHHYVEAVLDGLRRVIRTDRVRLIAPRCEPRRPFRDPWDPARIRLRSMKAATLPSAMIIIGSIYDLAPNP
jgi:hypothetical protein